jgi:hypothetical protein
MHVPCAVAESHIVNDNEYHSGVYHGGNPHIQWRQDVNSRLWAPYIKAYTLSPTVVKVPNRAQRTM